jgi:hypothetical protein
MMNPARPVTYGKRKRIFIALVSAIVVSLAANGIESIVIRLVRPSEQALTWVSDLVISGRAGRGHFICDWIFRRLVCACLG